MSPETEKELLARVSTLETNVNRLLMKFEQATGALIVLKWMGWVAGGIWAVSTFLIDHLKGK